MEKKRKTIDNCQSCGGFLPIVESGLCQPCYQREHELLDEVRLYLRDHPNAPADELQERFEVDSNRLQTWVREGKIRCVVFKAHCPSCGVELVNQFYCVHCHKNVMEITDLSTHQTYVRTVSRVTVLDRFREEDEPRHRRRRFA